MFYTSFIKPFIDSIVAITILLILFPILIIISLLLFFDNGEVFFVQERPGRNERIFKLIKFKTMNDNKDELGQLLSDEKRLTWVGKIIRKTSLDEIPQMINVLKGDMSLIGPRPLLVEYLQLYNEVQKKRHTVKPGISGWAQVKGRNLLSWEEKFKYDVYYAEHLSFWFDVKILFLTIFKIFKSEGISGENVATMEKFKGNS